MNVTIALSRRSACYISKNSPLAKVRQNPAFEAGRECRSRLWHQKEFNASLIMDKSGE